MPVKFNTKDALSKYKKLGGKTFFEDDLKDVLKYIQNDKNINTVEQAAYLLATVKAESDYSFERWESDYVCGKKGVAYKDKPCQAALNYYRSTDGKKNYYLKGVDDRGLPYFGRGLIQLTGQSNYKKYGDRIGVDLEKNPELVFKPKNSYGVTSEFLKEKTWKYVDKGELTLARRSVNGGTRGEDKVNSEYNKWLEAFKQDEVNFKKTKITRKQRKINVIGYSILGISFVGLAYAFYHFTNKK